MNALQLMQTQRAYAIVYKKMPFKLQQQAYHLCWKYNVTDPNRKENRQQILNRLFRRRSNVMINSPFHCDYGFNVHFQGFAFLNYGSVILDTSPVTIGNGAMIAPHVCLACSGHSVNYRQRIEGVMTSRPIAIGNHVWIGADSFVNGGVTIGNHSVIGAGSVVTKDIPSDVVAFGSPCQVHRKITKQDFLRHVIGNSNED